MGRRKPGRPRDVLGDAASLARLDSCYIVDTGGFDPACADGFSNVLTLLVAKPTVRYTARVTTYRFLREASLELTATPLGEKRAYRVCYRTRNGRGRCLRGTLDGFGWNESTSDTLTVSTRNLAKRTAFMWYVGVQKVAAKRVVIP